MNSSESTFENLVSLYDDYTKRLKTAVKDLDKIEPVSRSSENPEKEQFTYKGVLAEEIFDQLITDFILEMVYNSHRDAKQSVSNCPLCLTKCRTYVDLPGVDIFGQDPTSSSQVLFKCESCQREYPSSRFANHMDKCMGLSSRRMASRRLSSKVRVDFFLSQLGSLEKLIISYLKLFSNLKAYYQNMNNLRKNSLSPFLKSASASESPFNYQPNLSVLYKQFLLCFDNYESEENSAALGKLDLSIEILERALRVCRAKASEYSLQILSKFENFKELAIKLQKTQQYLYSNSRIFTLSDSEKNNSFLTFFSFKSKYADSLNDENVFMNLLESFYLNFNNWLLEILTSTVDAIKLFTSNYATLDKNVSIPTNILTFHFDLNKFEFYSNHRDKVFENLKKDYMLISVLNPGSIISKFEKEFQDQNSFQGYLLLSGTTKKFYSKSCPFILTKFKYLYIYENKLSPEINISLPLLSVYLPNFKWKKSTELGNNLISFTETNTNGYALLKNKFNISITNSKDFEEFYKTISMLFLNASYYQNEKNTVSFETNPATNPYNKLNFSFDDQLDTSSSSTSNADSKLDFYPYNSFSSRINVRQKPRGARVFNKMNNFEENRTKITLPRSRENTQNPASFSKPPSRGDPQLKTRKSPSPGLSASGNISLGKKLNYTQNISSAIKINTTSTNSTVQDISKDYSLESDLTKILADISLDQHNMPIKFPTKNISNKDNIINALFQKPEKTNPRVDFSYGYKPPENTQIPSIKKSHKHPPPSPNIKNLGPSLELESNKDDVLSKDTKSKNLEADLQETTSNSIVSNSGTIEKSKDSEKHEQNEKSKGLIEPETSNESTKPRKDSNTQKKSETSENENENPVPKDDKELKNNGVPDQKTQSEKTKEPSKPKNNVLPDVNPQTFYVNYTPVQHVPFQPFYPYSSTLGFSYIQPIPFVQPQFFYTPSVPATQGYWNTVGGITPQCGPIPSFTQPSNPELSNSSAFQNPKDKIKNNLDSFDTFEIQEISENENPSEVSPKCKLKKRQTLLPVKVSYDSPTNRSG
ncbi:hypothetical protein BB560_002992 [Smittium megazygosporum]|uniref:SAGA-associated factor 11 n=1 Tax=Smittium megazygosporum TaxID=133381 RepID=A0A2T9ZD91_9FUNG|nr:hypothetical protein BB560_002992 [Smittium megazygosporum]